MTIDKFVGCTIVFPRADRINIPLLVDYAIQWNDVGMFEPPPYAYFSFESL